MGEAVSPPLCKRPKYKAEKEGEAGRGWAWPPHHLLGGRLLTQRVGEMAIHHCQRERENNQAAGCFLGGGMVVVVVVGPRRSFVLDRAGEVAVTSPMFLRHRTPPAPSDRSAMCSLFDKWVWPPLPLSSSAGMPPRPPHWQVWIVVSPRYLASGDAPSPTGRRAPPEVLHKSLRASRLLPKGNERAGNSPHGKQTYIVGERQEGSGYFWGAPRAPGLGGSPSPQPAHPPYLKIVEDAT